MPQTCMCASQTIGAKAARLGQHGQVNGCVVQCSLHTYMDKVEDATAVVAETGSQQSDRADDREVPQVQHIEIKEVPRSSTLTR